MGGESQESGGNFNAGIDSFGDVNGNVGGRDSGGNDASNDGRPFQQTMSWTGGAAPATDGASPAPASIPAPIASPAPSTQSSEAAVAPVVKPQVVWSSAPAPASWSSGAVRRDE
jgi:hypothetical protein